jgi:regulator of protease activity HflC (stomatin/prohibitin superfamily)
MRARLPVAVLLLLLVPFFLWPHTTGPTEVGVRTVKWSPFGTKGVLPAVYDPGATYFFPAIINDWHTFDTKMQNVEMTYDRSRGDRPTRDDLLFKTIDGNDISLDVIVTYRLKKEEAPKIVQEVATTDFELKDKIVRTIARSRPRDIFGELKTEEFYVSDRRDEKAERAKDELNKLFEPYGIVVERVSTKDYLKRLEDAKGDVAKMVAEADGRFRQAQIEADAYYEQQQRIAAAIEAEGAADAKGITEMNKALAGSGGEVMVKLKLAEALEGKKILLLPSGGGGIDLKTTNVNRLLEAYGAQALAGGSDGSR